MRKDERNIKILVIEDNPGDFLLIEEFLMEEFAHPFIKHASRLKEAVNLFRDEDGPFDVVLLDLSLPDKSGEDLITVMLKIAGDIPVIVLTGYTDVPFSIKSLSMGVSDYLLKDDLNGLTLYKSISYSIERRGTLKKLKDSEKRYRDIFHLSPLPMWVFDRNSLQLMDVNQAAIQHYGFSREEFLSMKITDLRPKEDQPIIPTVLTDYENGFNKSATLEGHYRHRKKDGEIIFVELKFSNIPYLGSDSRLILANDVTERIEKEAALEESYKLILSIEEEERKRFAAEVHDGIAQNLVSLNLFFQLFEEAEDVTGKNKYSTIIKKLLQDTIRECKKISHNAQPKDLLDNGLRYMLQTMAEKVREAGGVKISISCPENIDQILSGYSQFAIYRIIQENFTNMMKHSDARKVVVNIRVSDSKLYIRFADNGVGIDEETRTARSSFLTIKRRVVALKGKFEVKSEVGNGAEFSYVFPVEEDSESETLVSKEESSKGQ